MFKTATDTTKVHDVLLQLESLHAAFSALLEQAKAQLEAIDLTDEHLRKIGDRILGDRDLRSDTASQMSSRLADLIDQHGTDIAGANTLVYAIARRLDQCQRESVESQIRSYLESETFDALIQRRAFQILDAGSNRHIDDLVRQRLREIILALYGAGASADSTTAFSDARTQREEVQ
jgi:phenylalanyl-tRNA synthetase alpha subunit